MRRKLANRQKQTADKISWLVYRWFLVVDEKKAFISADLRFFALVAAFIKTLVF